MQTQNLQVYSNIRDLQFQSSFSSSSSSQGSMLNLSDIVSLCDKDVRLDFTYIKMMFKGIVNKLHHLQLAQTIKGANLRMSGSEDDFKKQEDKNDKQTKNKNRQSDDDVQAQLVMEIKQKKSQDVENKSKQKKKKKSETAPEKIQTKKSQKKDKNKSKQKLLARQQILKQQDRVYSDIQIQRKVIQLQKQALKIKSLLSSLKYKLHESNLKQGQQLQKLLNQQQKSNQDYKITVDNKSQSIEKKDPTQCFEIDSKFYDKFSLNLISGKYTVTYIGSDNQENVLYLNQKKFEASQQCLIRILKSKSNNIKIGLINAKYYFSDPKQKQGNSQSILYDGNNGYIIENGCKQKQEGTGFRENDVVTLKIQKEKNKKYEIEWIVNGIVRAVYSSQKLLNKNNEWLPCIIFTNNGDSVKVR